MLTLEVIVIFSLANILKVSSVAVFAAVLALPLSAKAADQAAPSTNSSAAPSEAPSAAPSANLAPDTSGAAAAPTTWAIKPGQPISVGMTTEDTICTYDVALAKRQREAFPDSAEAGFIYAVALSRTSQIETALKEVRRAKRLAENDGGPTYFDNMIASYEKMLTYTPDDNQVRYHLAWAYYMKAYLLERASHQTPQQNAKYAAWIAQAQKEAPASTDTAKTDTAKTDTANSVTPDAIPQVKRYYALALAKLDDLLLREPDDVWARVYRAHLQAESSGNIDQAMIEWQKVKEASPLNPAAYFFLGQGYLKKGNLKESMSNVSKAIALRATGN